MDCFFDFCFFFLRFIRTSDIMGQTGRFIRSRENVWGLHFNFYLYFIITWLTGKLGYFKAVWIISNRLKCEIGNAPFFSINRFTVLLKSQNKMPSSKKAEQRRGTQLSHHTFASFIIKTNTETCCIPALDGQGSESK